MVILPRQARDIQTNRKRIQKDNFVFVSSRHSWLKIRQEDANNEMQMTGVWKDGLLTRCIPGGWNVSPRFDIVREDGLFEGQFCI